MKPNNTLEAVREGDLGGEKIDMSFDANSIHHIMAILTDLYEDPELAVIREYSTNAIDSHIESGNPAPIEVYKPNSMSPFFRVIDHGIGLNVDGIRDVYSKYGASTKRDTNTQTGMLGVGCKSALTYSNQFTVVGVKDGVKTIVAISRNEEGGGVMEVIDTLATDEPNGVEISVPAKTGHFSHKVDAFFQWWKPGTVLVDGEAPRQPKMDKMADNVYLMDQHAVGAPASDIVIMGNVPYNVGNRLTGTTHRASYFRVIAYVDMGAVNFTPSREALHYTKKTEAEITRIATLFTKGAQTWGTEQLKAATSHREAFQIRSLCKARFGDSIKYEWNGKPIPASIYVNQGVLVFNPHTTSKYNVNSTAQLDNIEPNQILFVEGFNKDELTTPIKQKARKYVENVTGVNVRHVVFVRPSAVFNEYVSEYVLPDNTITFEELEAYKPPRKVNLNPVVKSDPVYSVWNIKAGDQYAKDMKLSELKTSLAGGHVAYVSTTDIIEEGYWSRRPENYQVVQRAHKYASLAGAEYLIILGRNRWDKLNRDLPGLKHLRVMLAEKITSLEASMNASDKLNLSIDETAGEVIRKFTVKSADEIDDPEFAQLTKDLNAPHTKYYENRHDYHRALRQIGTDGTIDRAAKEAVVFDPSKHAKDAKAVVARYPLMRHIGRDAPLAEKVFYVNARYASIKDGK